MPSAIDKVQIFGIGVDSVDQKRLLQRVLEWAKQSEQKSISYVNAHCLNLAMEGEEYRQILNQMDLVYSDGIGVVWAGRFLHRKKLFKVTGRTWIDEFCRLCQNDGISVYLLGSKPGVAREAQKRLLQRFPKLKLIGACDGYFHEKNEAELLTELTEEKPDILMVGMGVPQQEEWILNHREQIESRVCWAVGALLDYVAGVEPPVPSWMDHLALEWLWRMVIDPRDKWRRYIIGNPKFIFRVIIEKCR